MRLHSRLLDRAKKSDPDKGEQQLIEQYRRARPFLKSVLDVMGDGSFRINVLQNLQEGNPNVERLIFFREGWEDAMRQLRSLIEPEIGG